MSRPEQKVTYQEHSTRVKFAGLKAVAWGVSSYLLFCTGVTFWQVVGGFCGLMALVNLIATGIFNWLDHG